jgi:hypothetical protein
MWRRVLILAAVMASGCGPAAPTDEALAAEIERQVQAAHPDIPLRRYARFYAWRENGAVEGVYSHADEGEEPMVGRVNEVVWTSPEDLPAIHDGGCAVISISFDAKSNRLRRVECNVGDA